METRIPRYLLPALRLVVWMLPAALLLFAFVRNFAPSGSFIVRCFALKCDGRISNFAVKEPTKEAGTTSDTRELFRAVTVDPLYFDVKLFRPMERATVQLTYRNPNAQPGLKVGVFGKGKGYEFQDLVNAPPVVQAVEGSWNVVRDNDVAVFMRPDPSVLQYKNVGEFLENLPDANRTVTYHADLLAQVRIPGYQPSSQFRTDNVTLRGPHTFLTYLGKGEALNLSLSVQDHNRRAGEDPMQAQVFYGEKLVTTATLPDDGNVKANDAVSPVRDLTITTDETGEGIYRIVIDANDDIFIRSLKMKQQFFMIKGRLSLAGDSSYASLSKPEGGSIAMPIYARGTTLTAQTDHQESLQVITVGSKKLNLNTLHEQMTVPLDGGGKLVPIFVPVRDVAFNTDGVFAFSAEHALPILAARSVEELGDSFDLASFDYIYARYKAPREEQGWLVAGQTIENLPRSSKLSFFIVGDPPIGETKKSIEVKELEVRFEGDPLTPRSIVALLRRFLGQLKQGQYLSP